MGFNSSNRKAFQGGIRPERSFDSVGGLFFYFYFSRFFIFFCVCLVTVRSLKKIMPSANTWCVPVPLHSSQSAMALLHSNHKAYLITLMVRPGMQTIIRTLRDLSLILSGSQLWARPKVHCTTSRCYNDVFSQSWFFNKIFFLLVPGTTRPRRLLSHWLSQRNSG